MTIVQHPHSRHAWLRADTTRQEVADRLRSARWVIAAVLLLVTATACTASANGGTGYTWDFSAVQPYLGDLVNGIKITLLLTVIVIVIGMPLGLIIAAGRLSRFWPVRLVFTIYVEIMRGVPTLVLLFWVYYVLPVLFGINLPAFVAGVVGLTANVAAFYGEAFRSGIQGIPKVELEAGDILGFKYIHRLRYIIIPQAFRAVLPVLISLSVSLFKDTSLVSTLGVAELMYQSQQVAVGTYRPMEVFTAAALFYLVIALPVTWVARRVEIYMRRHLRL